MADLNKDGLEIGKPVSFEEMRKVQLKNPTPANLESPKVDIPNDWQNMSFPAKRELAQRISGRTVIHSVEEMDAIISGAVSNKSGTRPKPKKSEPAPQKKPEVAPVKPSGDLVDIPSDWETQPFMSKRSLARKIAGSDKINKGDEVNYVIRAELEKRGA